MSHNQFGLLLFFCGCLSLSSGFPKNLYTGPNRPPSLTAQYWRDTLKLGPLIGGGYFKETYRSNETTSDLPKRFGIRRRTFGTAIYYLLEGHQFDAFHILKADEMWHFYYGKPLSIYLIKTNGDLEVVNLGPRQDHHFQFLVPRGTIFAAQLKDPKPGDYSLVGTTVCPGFENADYDLLNRTKLIEQYPQHEELITSLTY